ncbi:hypothetical protein LX15_005134 [Streptoalloteichus tenebrarius]|uniref:Uncharacterized protein n=1 Tax=Streptoalloteichus tenebrarius (strain ATCC 17920 / DSM 40477 / JCM 4838 / CBS 697.72 / NBRC 16177 / NCIMB 11028 / NRRL B-12390 / A12253. 1 / ISP 5477) TaxID=1933 RepID=A0ABT1I0U3_STRSD|nr:hypothetical protein [Streptoalloteichus tenebrarius]MCP2261408.1 hypothetical protein [Streptoalloteichus tenebrarius]BFF02011.1 hypothetical protein GCM10020241_36860 [Streptoalloteichus tenebrarius]
MPSQWGTTGGRLTRSLARVLLAVAGAVVGVLASWLVASATAAADGPLAGVTDALGAATGIEAPAPVRSAAQLPVGSLRSLEPAQPVRRLADSGPVDLLGGAGLAVSPGENAESTGSAADLSRSVARTVPRVDDALRSGVAGLTEHLRGAPVDHVRPVARTVNGTVDAVSGAVNGIGGVGGLPGTDAVGEAIGGGLPGMPGLGERRPGAGAIDAARGTRTVGTSPSGPLSRPSVLPGASGPLAVPGAEHGASAVPGPVSPSAQPGEPGAWPAAGIVAARALATGGAASAAHAGEPVEHGGPLGDPEPVLPDHGPGQPATLPGPCHCGHDGSGAASGGPAVTTTAPGAQLPLAGGRGSLTPAAQRGGAGRVEQPGVTPD